MQEEATIIVKSGKDQSLKRFHPWVFSGAIKKMHGDPQEGDIVAVYSNQNEFLGRGHYQNDSIAIRVLTFQDEPINEDFWAKRFRSAYQLRKRLNLTDNAQTNAYRLVHAEGDQLPGLIIDIYNDTAVIQAHSAGMYFSIPDILPHLKEMLGDKLARVYNKSENTIPRKSGIEVKNEYVLGEPGNAEVKEHACKFFIDWTAGQKTGFFLDQRENRRLLGQYAKGKTVCNTFGYTGGFSVYALQHGASHVDTVDSSKNAIDLCQQNIELNGFSDKHKGIAADAFEYLQNMDTLYDIIILDPPAFAKHQNVLHNALQGYKRLNEAAIRKSKPGGLIFTFSCSQVVSKENFRRSLFVASANTGRHVRILHQLEQPADHPVSIFHPESEYLKGFVLQVE